MSTVVLRSHRELRILINLEFSFRKSEIKHVIMNETFTADRDGFYGEFGGAFIPEMLRQNVESLRSVYHDIIESADFNAEFRRLLETYAGRPSPLYLAERLSRKYGARIYLKREDLNHTGSHKINNTIGQVILAKRMGKTRIIAETG